MKSRNEYQIRENEQSLDSSSIRSSYFDKRARCDTDH